MDATFEFSINGPNMELAFNLMLDGHDVPNGLFVDILTEKCQLIHKHICKVKDNLMMVTNITNTVATIKFFNKELEDSQLVMVTISNLPNLEDQLYQLWIEVHCLLEDYSIDNHAAELCSIDKYYSELEYNEMIQADLLF